jgi:hypothetical protein
MTRYNSAPSGERITNPERMFGRSGHRFADRTCTTQGSRARSDSEGTEHALIDLAHCSRLHRIIVAGSNSPQTMFELHRRGYNRVGTTATCGLPHGQYDVALVDWRGRTIKALETTLNWLVHFLGSSAIVAIRVDPQERAANRKLAAMLEKLGFRIEIGTRCENGLAVSARRRDAAQMSVCRVRAS